MPAAIVARSLTSLNDLADTPPSNPPLQLQGEEPLVLYISRVPGSRDVFLSPMKPRDKVISANDIESSLYYCHLAGESDQDLLKDEDWQGKETNVAHNVSPACSNENIRHLERENPRLLQRISMEQSVQPILPRRPLATDKNNSASTAILRKPIAASPQSNQIGSVPSLTARKILGPRPITNFSGPSPQPLSNFVDDVGYTHASNSDASSLQERPGLINDQKSPIKRDTSSSSKTTVTIIRRDPGTGDQWNIGRLFIPTQSKSQSPSRSPKKRKRDIVLELSSPGYMRFVDGSQALATEPFTRNLSLDSGTKPNSSFSSDIPQTDQEINGFLSPWRTPCRFQTTAGGRVLKCYHNLPASLLAPSARALSGGNPPTMLVSELRFNLPSLGDRITTKKKENRRPKSYSSFGTSKNSFSPSLLTPPSSQFNDARMNSDLPAPKLAPRPISYQGHRTAPWLPPKTDSEQPSSFHVRSQPGQAHSQLADSNIEGDLDDFEEMDLSLGQEMAGGGFSGNKAKLGKLVIYGGQGVAMLDLLVAANMGVWFNNV